MALAAVLSAFKELILNVDGIPSDFGERIGQYSKLFSDLSPQEIEDLAKMEPDRLHTYTRSILGGTSSVLRNHFPVTLARLKSAYEDDLGKSFDITNFTAEMIRRRPWKSASTFELAEIFQKTLIEDLPEIIDIAPELSSLAHLEHLGLIVKRHPAQDFPCYQTMPIQDLSVYTVEQLLNLPIFVPRYAQMLESDFDILSYRREFYRSGDKLPNAIDARPIAAILSRDGDNYLSWTEIPVKLIPVLEELQISPSKVSLLAEAYLNSCEFREEDEAKLFAAFLELLVNLSKAGAVVLNPMVLNQPK